MHLFRYRLPVGVFLYMVPMGFSWFIFWQIAKQIEPDNSIENSFIAYGIFLVLIIASFIGGYIIAKSGRKRPKSVKLFFSITGLILFLPILAISVPIGLLIMFLQAILLWISPVSLYVRIKNSPLGCNVTSILAAMIMFSNFLYVREIGNVKTAKSINWAVLVANHESSGDYPIAAILAMFRNWRVLIGANLWKYKLLNIYFTLVGIPIERERNKEAAIKRKEAVQKAKDFLTVSKKGILVVFASGSRDRNPMEAMEPFKPGAFDIACELGIPIIPITIVGTNKWRPPSEKDTTTYKGKKTGKNLLNLFWGYIKQYFKSGINPTIVKVIYGTPIPTLSRKSDDVRMEAEQVIRKTYLIHAIRYEKK